MLKVLKNYQNMTIQAKAGLWFLLCSFLQKGISTISTPIFTRLMTPAEFGQYSVFNSWFSILQVIVVMPLYGGMYIQRLTKFSDEHACYASALQGLALTLCLAWTGVYLLFRSFWNEVFKQTTVQMLALFVMIWTTAIFGLWSGVQRVEYRYKSLVTVTIAVTLAKPLLGIVLVLNSKDKVTARILGLVVVELVVYAGLFYTQMRQGRKFFSKEYWRYALLVGIPLIPHYLAGAVLSGADRIMIRDMVDEASAGVYSLAYSISQVMILFNTALVQTTEPWIYEKIKKHCTEEIPQIVYPSMGVIAVLNIMLIAMAPEIVRLFAPPKYAEAIWVIPPVAMSVYFQFLYAQFCDFEFYYEHTRLVAASTAAAAVLNIILNYIFIPRFGYVAAGYTTLFCYVVYAMLHYYGMQWVCKKYDIKKVYDWRVLVLITALLLAGGMMFLTTYKIMWLRYCILGLMLLIMVLKRKVILQMAELLLKTKT